MYKNGEIDMVMNEFEKALTKAPIYIGGSIERADKVEIDNPDGRISKHYKNNNYYNNGKVNEFFIMYLWGYSCGKFEGRSEALHD